MVKIQMTVIPKPKEDTAAVIIKRMNPTMKYPFATMYGSGDTDYICGACRTTIVIGASQGQINNIVFKCSKCGAYNILRGTTL